MGAEKESAPAQSDAQERPSTDRTTSSTKAAPEQLSALSAKQSEALAEFRKRVDADGIEAELPEFMHGDIVLARYLRARNYDVDAALAMLKNTIKWRRELNLDEEYDKWTLEDSEALQSIWPQYFHGVDSDGRPIYIQHLGGIDTSELNRVFPIERLKLALAVSADCVLRERFPACSEKAGRPIQASTVIMNLDKLSLSGFWNLRNPVNAVIKQAQDNYPEMSVRIVIVNSPSWISKIWAWVRPVLSQQTADKVNIASSQDNAKIIGRFADLDQVPVELGGTCPHCKPASCLTTDYGPWDAEKTLRR